MNFINVYQFVFPLQWDKMAKVAWSWVFPFLQVSEALIKPQDVRLWLTSSS